MRRLLHVDGMVWEMMEEMVVVGGDDGGDGCCSWR